MLEAMAFFKIDNWHAACRDRFSKVSQIKGIDIHIQQTNEKVGSVVDVIVDQVGQAHYLILDIGAWASRKMVFLPIDRFTYDSANKIYTTDLSKQQLESLREYEVLAPPDQSGEDDQQQIFLYEERLVMDTHREKTGEVIIKKQIETEQVEASVPIQKEKIIIEIESIGRIHVHTPDEVLREGAAHIDIYQDQLDIRKEAVIRQEVSVRKEIEEEIVTVDETLRREKLNLEQEGSVDIIELS